MFHASQLLPSFSELITSIPNESLPISPGNTQYRENYVSDKNNYIYAKQLSSPRSSPTLSLRAIKRKYVCKTCTRSFTTSGHLARHNRIHTGERKHCCPFEGCDARFARQDNCMQHYKTHNNGKAKRNSSIEPTVLRPVASYQKEDNFVYFSSSGRKASDCSSIASISSRANSISSNYNVMRVNSIVSLTDDDTKSCCSESSIMRS